VKDLLSVLRWVQNPRGRLAGFRVAQLVPGLGPASARRLLDTMAAERCPGRRCARLRKPPAAAAHDWPSGSPRWGRCEGAGWPAL
jgi:DNA helicase-2/ATP-dependent DNA helicase PcrA